MLVAPLLALTSTSPSSFAANALEVDTLVTVVAIGLANANSTCKALSNCRFTALPINGRSKDKIPDKTRLSSRRYATSVLSIDALPRLSVTGLNLSNIPTVLDGQIDPFVAELRAADEAERLGDASLDDDQAAD